MLAEDAERRKVKVEADARELKQRFNHAVEERNMWAR